MNPVPSVIDLPAAADMAKSSLEKTTASNSTGKESNLRARKRSASVIAAEMAASLATNLDEMSKRKQPEVQRFDADVLTKVIVYSGVCLSMPLKDEAELL